MAAEAARTSKLRTSLSSLHSNTTQVRERLMKKINKNENQADYERRLLQKDLISTNYSNHSEA